MIAKGRTIQNIEIGKVTSISYLIKGALFFVIMYISPEEAKKRITKSKPWKSINGLTKLKPSG